MRRTDKEMSGRGDISQVIENGMVCRIALAKDNQPYIVPVSYGYDGEAIYFHTYSKSGLKLDYLAANKKICFEIENNVELVAHDEKPCSWSFKFQSVVGFGEVTELTTDASKSIGLKSIMKQYSEKEWSFEGVPLSTVAVWKITITSMTGKQSSNFAV